ncbi:MAG: hypothetical protein WCI28_09495 [Opitutaceae bacterium]|jgi:hypothetical protein|nr:hypothetical protein [Opitutaceae bacterium]
MKKMTPAELEDFIDQNLRTLPVPCAPRTLEARVWAQLQRQAPLAWYQQSWTYWPIVARISFLILVVSMTAAMLVGFYFWFVSLQVSAWAIPVSQYLSIFARLYHGSVWFAQFSGAQACTIPSLWLYGSLTIISGLYAAFCGLSTAAYRLLYHNH